MPEGQGVQFPQGFLWGAATAAYQIEGNTRVDGRDGARGRIAATTAPTSPVDGPEAGDMICKIAAAEIERRGRVATSGDDPVNSILPLCLTWFRMTRVDLSRVSQAPTGVAPRDEWW